MNILFITPRLPFPLDSGAKIRTFNLLNQIRSNNKVHLLSFIYSNSDIIYAKEIEKLGINVITVKNKDNITISTIIKALLKRTPVNLEKYRSKKMINILVSLVTNNQFDLVHFDHLHLGQYVDICGNVPTIIDEHNIESEIWKRLYKKEINPLKKIIFKQEYKKINRMEKDKCNKASVVTVVSEEDKVNLQKLLGSHNNSKVVPNGVDTDYFQDTQGLIDKQEDVALFVGSMDWLPNDDAMDYFLKDILPLIWAKIPSMKLYLVGKNPSLKLKKINQFDKRITVTGSVQDVRPYMQKAKVFIVPIRFGGGTRLKILEALSMKKAIVSTSLGAEGIPIKDGKNILIADEPNDFADKVIHLLENDILRQQLGEEGRKFVVENFDWKIIGKELNKVYQELSS